MEWLHLLSRSTNPYLVQISQIKVSTILLFLLKNEWKQRQTNYPQGFNHSWSMEWLHLLSCSTPYLAQISLSPQIKVSTILLF